MVKRIFVLLAIVMLAACKGGNKGPVMANPSEEIDYNQDATEHVANITSEKKDVDIQHDEGILSIAEVFKNRESLSGKIITVKGEVTKYNPAIMGRNWVHIQDGTDYSGEFDLTITTSSEVKVGDQVVFSGVLALDRDFGYGYRYSTLVEGAELKK